MNPQRKPEGRIPSPAPLLAASAILLASGFFGRSPIVNALSGSDVTTVRLHTSHYYSAIAPLSNVFDGMTLLSLPQVFSALGFVCAVAVTLRARKMIDGERKGLPGISAKVHLRFALNLFGAIVAFAGLALLVPRPMADLRVNDPDVVAIDFHSHTSASHDGRPSFTPEANREWHSAAGFNVAYVTDHHTFAGAHAAMLANPRLAGDGTVLLPGLEYRDDDEHVIALGLDPSSTNAERREWHPLSAGDTTAGRDAPTLLILSLPADVKRIPPDEEIGIARLAAVEIADGSPRGLEQAAGDKREIFALARKERLSLVSGSDNHGWGRTSSAWTLMRIPRWHTMRPQQLDAMIRTTLASSRGMSTIVITRRLPSAASPMAIALTGPALALEIVRDIGWEERASWIGWTIFGWGLAVAAARRRTAGHVQVHSILPPLVPEMIPEPIE